MLEWVELAPETQADEKTAQIMDRLLEKAGCSVRMLVPGEARALLGGTLDIAGDPARPPAGPVARLVRGAPPGAHQIFTESAIVPPNVWQPLQNQRVRYFRKAAAKGASDAGAPAAADAAGAPPPVPASSAPPPPAPGGSAPKPPRGPEAPPGKPQ